MTTHNRCIDISNSNFSRNEKFTRSKRVYPQTIPYNNKHHIYINACIKQAHQSNMAQILGAVLVDRNGQIISKAFNKRTNANYEQKLSIHAEMMCISKVHYSKLKDCVLYVVRVSSGGRLTTSKPCRRCAKKLSDAGLKRVYYIN